MKYSEIFIRNGFRVDLLVDNATTHTKALIDISMFAKSINRACPVNEIKWFENGVEKSIDCFFRRGNLNGQSKGLFNLCKELGIIESSLNYSKISLKELREQALKHPAFTHISVLEDFIRKWNLKNKMDINLQHAPKFHVELNPIEMYWAHLKSYFRKHNEQSNNEEKVVKQILEARENYMKTDVNSKLFSRFWRLVDADARKKLF